MNKRQYREKQVKKTLNEFMDKGYNVNKVFGRNAENIAKSKASYEKFQQRVRKERSYQRERIKVNQEVQEYKERRNKEVTEEVQKGLYELYKDDAGIYYAKKEQYGININTVRKGQNAIQEKIAEGNIKMLTDEMDYTDKNGKQRANGAFFKNTSEEQGVEEKLNELRKMMADDPNAIRNISTLTNYLYEKIIPLKYEMQVVDGNEVPPTYSEHAKAPLKFFKETADKLVKKYKSLL